MLRRRLKNRLKRVVRRFTGQADSEDSRITKPLDPPPFSAAPEASAAPASAAPAAPEPTASPAPAASAAPAPGALAAPAASAAPELATEEVQVDAADAPPAASEEIEHSEASEASEAASPLDALDDFAGPPLTLEAVQEILDEMVRPALQADGGDITLLDVRDSNIYVKLVGSCSTCPSSIMTMKMGVERLLMEEFPTMNELVQVEA